LEHYSFLRASSGGSKILFRVRHNYILKLKNINFF
jgi:hypothetical protein